MKIRYLILITTMAFLGFSVNAVAHPCDRHNDKSHKHCDEPGDGDSIVYTAELIGAFVNPPGVSERIVNVLGVVTPNKRKSSLHGEALDISRPGYTEDTDDCEYYSIEVEGNVNADAETFDACMTWNHVFNTCTLLLAPDSVEGIYVGADNWSIQRAGGVYVQLVDITFENGAQVSMNLYGDKSSDDPFLPPVGDPSEFILGEFATWGKLPGAGPKLGCEPFENNPLGYFYKNGDERFQETFIKLRITATETSTSP